jgi:hypothetical protein
MSGVQLKRWRVVGILSLAVAAMAAGGCQKPLFAENDVRSQYDRFDAVRDRRAPTWVFDEYGARRPNLRGRVLTSE